MLTLVLLVMSIMCLADSLDKPCIPLKVRLTSFILFFVFLSWVVLFSLSSRETIREEELPIVELKDASGRQIQAVIVDNKVLHLTEMYKCIFDVSKTRVIAKLYDNNQTVCGVFPYGFRSFDIVIENK